MRWRGLLCSAMSWLACAADGSGVGEESAAARMADECWGSGMFSYEQCCSTLFGPSGNPVCWSESVTARECCTRGMFTPKNCHEFVAHFDFSVLPLHQRILDGCEEGLQEDPDSCNHFGSPHAKRYLACVRRLQESGIERKLTTAGGVHFPVLVTTHPAPLKLSFITPAFDAYVGSSLATMGGWMQGEVDMLRALISPGDVVVDAGANLGGFTIPFALAVGEAGQVHAFEPFRLLHQALTANVAINGLANVWTYQIGLGNETTTVTRPSPDLTVVSNPSKMQVADDGSYNMLARSWGDEPLEVRTLDSFALDRVSLLKIDVEGMEYELLQGARRMLKEHRPLVFLEDSANGLLSEDITPSPALDLMVAYYYGCYNLAKSGWADMTSLLCVPAEQADEVQAILQATDIRQR